MLLLARYVRAARAHTLDMTLYDIETQEPVHTITDASAEQEDEALITLAREWAARNGHTITDIDPSILNAA